VAKTSKDPLEGILDRKDEAGRELPGGGCPRSSRVGEFGRKRRSERSEKNSRDFAGPPTASATREKRVVRRFGRGRRYRRSEEKAGLAGRTPIQHRSKPRP